MKVLIVGDFCENGRFRKIINNNSFRNLLSCISPIIKDADYSIANFEYPIGTRDASPITKCGPNLCGSPESINVFANAGFKCATLANNHILDQGEKSALETQKLLENNNIDTVGFGTDVNDASKILYKSTNGETLAIINCCEHEFSIASDTSAGANAIDPISQYYAIREASQKANYIVVVTHSGHEHFQLPSLRQQELFRFYIDAGADAVVNHHQHCYSGYEIYKNKPIFYGLGNFIFDRDDQRSSKWNEGFILILSLSKKIGFDIIPYVQCDKLLDVCLMKEDEKASFYNTINELNSIISNKRRLVDALAVYYQDSSFGELRRFEPYKGRILTSMFVRGLLPSLLKKDDLAFILNHIECESHRDKLIFALKERLKCD